MEKNKAVKSQVRLCIRRKEVSRLLGEEAEIAALSLARAMLELSVRGNKNVVRDRKIYDIGEASGWIDLNPPKGFSYSEAVRTALVELENMATRFPNMEREEKIKYLKERVLEERVQAQKKETLELEREGKD